MDLLNDNGSITFITPNSWANGSNLGTKKNIFNSVFQKYNCTHINTSVNHFFPGIGKNISQWTITKSTYNGKTIVSAGDISELIDIQKYPFFPNVFSFESLEIFERVLEYGLFYSEIVEKATTQDRYYAFPKIRHNAGYRKGYRYDGENVDFPTSPVVVGIDCSNKTIEQVKSIHSQFESMVFKFLWKMHGANDAGSFGWILRNMPKLPDNTIYTDHDVFKILNLSKANKAYVEANVK